MCVNRAVLHDAELPCAALIPPFADGEASVWDSLDIVRQLPLSCDSNPLRGPDKNGRSQRQNQWNVWKAWPSNSSVMECLKMCRRWGGGGSVTNPSQVTNGWESHATLRLTEVGRHSSSSVSAKVAARLYFVSHSVKPWHGANPIWTLLGLRRWFF